MSRNLLSFSVLFAAVVSSIATSPARWSVNATDSGRIKIDRGDALEFEVDLHATAAALPEVDGGFSPQGAPVEGGLRTDLTIDLDLTTTGTLGMNRVDTTVVAQLWMDTEEGDWLVDEAEVDVLAGEPGFISLVADGVLATCPSNEPCDRSVTVVLEQSDDAKLKVKFDASLYVDAPLNGPAPKAAQLEVEVVEL